LYGGSLIYAKAIRIWIFFVDPSMQSRDAEERYFSSYRCWFSPTQHENQQQKWEGTIECRHEQHDACQVV